MKMVPSNPTTLHALAPTLDTTSLFSSWLTLGGQGHTREGEEGRSEAYLAHRCT